MPEDERPSFSEQEVQQRVERIGRDLVEKELYAEAIEEYKELVRAYPGSRWAANALMGIAECFHHLGQTDEELSTLEAIAEQFPDHVVAKRAQAALRLLRGSEAAETPAAAPRQEVTTATAFSRQVNSLRLSFLRYSMVGWFLSAVLVAVVFVLWRGMALREHTTQTEMEGINRRVEEMDARVDDLQAVVRGGTPVVAPAPAPEPSEPEPAEVAPAPPRPAPPPQARTYTVKPGDNLWGIAKRQLGDGRRVNEIAELNGLQEPYRIQVGDKLKLPPR